MIKERFKKAIKSNELDYKKISKILEISYNKINGMACGKQKITNKIAFLMEYHLNIDPLWLMFGIGDMFKMIKLKHTKPFDEDRDYDLLMEKRLQSSIIIRKELKGITPETVTKTDDEILLELLNKVADKDFKKAMIKQLKMIEDMQNGTN